MCNLIELRWFVICYWTVVTDSFIIIIIFKTLYVAHFNIKYDQMRITFQFSKYNVPDKMKLLGYKITEIKNNDVQLGQILIL
jgi:hypothetical protein